MASNPNERVQLERHERPVFAAASMPDGIPILLVGIPEKAWRHIRNGRTIDVDLTSHGADVRLMMFGAPNQYQAMQTLQAACSAKGIAYLDDRLKKGDDFRLKAPDGTVLDDQPELATEPDPRVMSREDLEIAVHSARSLIKNMEATIAAFDKASDVPHLCKHAANPHDVDRCVDRLTEFTYSIAVQGYRDRGQICPFSLETFAAENRPAAVQSVVVVLKALEPDA